MKRCSEDPSPLQYGSRFNPPRYTLAMKRWLKRILLAGLALLLMLVVGLAIIGVPKPPSATVSGVPRLPWGPALSAASIVRTSLDDLRGPSWDPSGEGLYVRGYQWMQPRILYLSGPAGEPQAVDVPARTGSFSANPNPALDYGVYSLDTGGNERKRLYRVDFDTGEHVPLTGSEHNAWMGRWSTDGRRLAFSSNERDAAHRDLYVMDPLHPEDVERVFEAEGSWSAVDWSPDGRRMLISQYVSVTESRPHVLDLETGEARPLVSLDSPARYRGLRWSSEPGVAFMLTDAGSEFARLVRVDVDHANVQGR